VEDYLLDCVEELQRAGDDPGRRKMRVQRPKAWSLLSKEWKALALLAANQAAPESVEPDASDAANARPARGSRRIGRRGGRGARSGLEDRLEAPRTVISSKDSAAYRLAVLIAQKQKMGDSWKAEWDEEADALRAECESGVHPVWERMAREAPLLAELGRFPMAEAVVTTVDSSEWAAAARFDPLDHDSLLQWLEACALNLDIHQASALQSIMRDLRSGKTRPRKWRGWMNPALLGLEGDAVILEAMLLAANLDDEAVNRFETVDSEELKGIASAQSQLLGLRSGQSDDWISAASTEGDDALSGALRLEAWKGFNGADGVDVDFLLSGLTTLSEAGLSAPDNLRWEIIEGLVSTDRSEEASELLEGLEIEGEGQMSIALGLISDSGDAGLTDNVIRAMRKASSEVVLSVMRDSRAPLSIRKRAADQLSSEGLGIEEEVLDIHTLSADIQGLSREFLSHAELASQFPHRALLVWHLIPANHAITARDGLEKMRRMAILSLAESKEDATLTGAASSLIALLSGTSSEMDAVHYKLDSDGVLALNEVRRALSAEGDGFVRENRIETLEQAVINAELTYLERSLFSALLNALRLNRATMDLQSGMDERRETALEALGILCAESEVAMRTIGFATDLVLEHDVSIPELEMWYRQHDNGSAEHQIVRATIARANGDRINAARSFRDAAMKVRDDFERSALLLRKSLIEFAHAGGWKEAVGMIDRHSELTAAVTSRFQLYLRACADSFAGRNEVATQRIIEYVNEREPSDPEIEGFDRDAVKRRLEVLDRALRYASEHRLPEDPFRGRVLAAQMMMRRRESSRRSELEGRFLLELNERKDVLEITLIAEEVAEISPIRGLRMFETAIQSGNFDLRQIQTLVRSQKALFRRYSRTIPVRQRSSLNHLALRPLVLVDTNILIDALKDDLLSQISEDQLGTFDWTVERAFVWMLKRRNADGRVHLSTPASAQAEFLNRTRNPGVALALFNDVYVDRKAWEEMVTPELLQERVQSVLRTFGSFRTEVDEDAKAAVDLDSFLQRHSAIFEKISEAKQLSRDNPPPRSEIAGVAIYPESGDLDIMRDSTVLAASTIPDVGCVLVATRDSDFMLIARALHDNFGFGAIWTAQQLNRHVSRPKQVLSTTPLS